MPAEAAAVTGIEGASFEQSVGLEPRHAPEEDAGGSVQIHSLRLRKLQLNQERKLLTKQLRNEQRKRQRLRERAKKLSNSDLVRVLAEREAAAIAKAKPKAKSRSSPARA